MTRHLMFIMILFSILILFINCPPAENDEPTPETTNAPTPAPIYPIQVTFAADSIIIPMDTTYQNDGIFKAYGLVFKLLKNDIPVNWVIKSGKSSQEVDFITDARDHVSSASIAAHGYRGGPFVVDSANAVAAFLVIDPWQTDNPSVAVHEATAGFTVDVAKVLVTAPAIAVFDDGNQYIARAYLQAAGIPDSIEDYTWPDTSPDILSITEISGPTTSDHKDGALFDENGDPVYSDFITMHWGVTDAQANPEVVAEVREFLAYPTHFFAQCQSVRAFENLDPYGFFLTPGGYDVQAQPVNLDYYHSDSPFAQFDGTFETDAGSDAAFSLVSGVYKATDITMLTAAGCAEGTYDIWISGYLEGSMPGRVSYLAGHIYNTLTPISSNPDSQGTRLFLNSLFASTTD